MASSAASVPARLITIVLMVLLEMAGALASKAGTQPVMNV